MSAMSVHHGEMQFGFGWYIYGSVLQDIISVTVWSYTVSGQVFQSICMTDFPACWAVIFLCIISTLVQGGEKKCSLRIRFIM